MEDFQKRMIFESDALNVKIGRLYDFVRSPKYRTLSGKEQGYIEEQLKAMTSYYTILRARIEFYRNAEEG